MYNILIVDDEKKEREGIALLLKRFGFPLRTAFAQNGEDALKIMEKNYFDILLTYSRVPRLTGYVAKKEMESFPILSIWMKRLHCLFLDRKDIKQGLKTILTGIDLIKNGISVCIFPEGTRNKSNDRLLPFKEGSLRWPRRPAARSFPSPSPILRSCSKITCPLSVPVTSSSSTANPSIRQNFQRKKRNSSVLTAANRLRTC